MSMLNVSVRDQLAREQAKRRNPKKSIQLDRNDKERLMQLSANLLNFAQIPSLSVSWRKA